MRLALISDIHGNSIALDAVLEDAARQQVNGYCFLGDLVDGHDPCGVLQRIAPLAHARFVHGNTESYIIAGEGPPALTLESVAKKPELLPAFHKTTAAWAWTKGCLCATGWYDWLLALPVEQRLVLPNGDRLLCVHASPGYADGPGIGPHTDDAELAELTEGCRADIVCVGHTHVAFERAAARVSVVNPGPVSNPLAPDLRAAYAILAAGEQGTRVIFRRVEYDHRAVVAAIGRSHHPRAGFLVDHQNGRLTVEDMIAAVTSRRHLIKARK